MDALQCFSSISEIVPSWITRVTDLAEHTSRKHAEFSEEFKRLASTSTGAPQPQRRKNSSVHSIRPIREGHVDSTHTSPSSSSSLSIGAENVVSAARPRRQLIIYYDSHTQFEFEQAVREISNARNLLRKGKMSQFMRGARSYELFASSRQSRESLHTAQLPPAAPATATGGYRLRSPVDQKESAFESAFESADKQLDMAQGLCETAAHHFLRTGDCTKQLELIRAKFETVLEIATQEASRLREEQEKQQQQQQQQPQEAGSTEMIATIVETSPKSLCVATTINTADKDKLCALANETIEVDDAASDSSIHIDITAFRSDRFRM